MKRLLSIVIVLLTVLSASAQTGGYDPQNPPEPSAKYKLTVKAQPEEAATTSGTGQYDEGKNVSVRATAKTNYVFKYWTQNGTQLSQTSTSFSLTMPGEDVELVAVFEYQAPIFDPTNPAEPQMVDPEYYLYLVANPTEGGSFNRISGKRAKEGEVLSLRASAATDYKLVGWYDSDGKELGTNATLSYTMPGNNTTLTARFEYSPAVYDPANPAEPSGNQDNVDNTNRFIEFADERVETICLENWDKNGDDKLSEGEAAVVTSLNGAFASKEITSFNELKYFTGLTMIEANGFRDCISLESLTLPDGLCEIGDNAFTNCTSLRSLQIPASVTRISDQSVFHFCLKMTAFTVAEGNNSYSAEDGILYSKDKSVLVCCPATKSGEMSLPATVRKIENNAFSMCMNLSSVHLPASIQVIGEAAFVGCSNLSGFDFPSTAQLQSVGVSCFTNCSRLTNFTVDNSTNGLIGSENGLFKVVDGVLFSTKTNGKLSVLEAYPCNHGAVYVVPDGVESIASYAFCMSIVEEVTLPASINLVQAYAFGYCINLKTVTAKMAKPCHAENAFEGIANTAALYVYPGLSEQFQNAEGWKVFTNIVEMEYTFKPGDANGDGVVSYSDVVAVLNRIIGGASDEHFVETAADVNNDGQVTVTDALMIVDMILEDEE